MDTHRSYNVKPENRLSPYEYHRVLSKAKPDTKSTDFVDYIAAKISNYQGKTGIQMDRKVLADRTGISFEMLKKILNGTKSTKKRDCIIAICFSLELDRDETNKALELYHMITLNPNRERDLVIIQSLANHDGIKELNKALEICNYSQLVVTGKEKHKFNDSVYQYPVENKIYTVLQQEIIPYDITGYEGDAALSALYRPERFTFDSYMMLRRNNDRKQLKITTDGFYTLFEKSDMGSYETVEVFRHLSECKEPELAMLFRQLEYAMDSKARQIVEMANDTKNYGKRLSAEISNQQLIIYGEAYNYSAPERSEYYQIDVGSGACQLSVSHRSMFMQKYLGKEDYSKYYGPPIGGVHILYSSLLDLEDKIENEQSSYNKYIMNQRIHHFEELLKAANDLLARIQNRDVYIFPKYIFDIYDIMNIFDVHNELESEVDKETGIMDPTKESFITANGTHITLVDLNRALELGITSVQGIHDIKVKHGSFEALLKL